METQRELSSGGDNYIDEQNELNRTLSFIQTLKTELIKQDAAIKKAKIDLADNQLDALQKEIEDLHDLIEATEQEADELTAFLVEDTHVKEFTMKKLFLIIAMPILVLSAMSAAKAIELADFDPNQYEYAHVDHVDIYLGLTFGMDPDEAFDTAQRQGTLLDRNEFMETYAIKGEARVEGYLGTIVFYSFWEDSETLAQFDCVFNESRTFSTVEKALTKKYGESPYNSENHRRLPDIHTGELHSYPTKSQDISDYSQRLIQTDENTYVIIHHYLDGTFAPYLYLHCMTITQIETNQNAKQIN